MKCNERFSSRHHEVHVGKGGPTEPLDEYGEFVADDGAICCFVGVEPGQKLSVSTHFSGKTTYLVQDVMVDGICRGTKFASSNGRTKMNKKDSFNTFLFLHSKGNLREAGIQVTGIRSDAELQPSTKWATECVGAIEVHVSVLRQPGEQFMPKDVTWFDEADNWAEAFDLKGRYSKLPPTYELKALEDNFQDLSKKSKNLKIKKVKVDRPGDAPWAIFRFYYRSMQAISELNLPVTFSSEVQGISYPLKIKAVDDSMIREILPVNESAAGRVSAPILTKVETPVNATPGCERKSSAIMAALNDTQGEAGHTTTTAISEAGSGEPEASEGDDGGVANAVEASKAKPVDIFWDPSKLAIWNKGIDEGMRENMEQLADFRTTETQTAIARAKSLEIGEPRVTRSEERFLDAHGQFERHMKSATDENQGSAKIGALRSTSVPLPGPHSSQIAKSNKLPDVAPPSQDPVTTSAVQASKEPLAALAQSKAPSTNDETSTIPTTEAVAAKTVVSPSAKAKVTLTSRDTLQPKPATQKATSLEEAQSCESKKMGRPRKEKVAPTNGVVARPKATKMATESSKKIAGTSKTTTGTSKKAADNAKRSAQIQAAGINLPATSSGQEATLIQTPLTPSKRPHEAPATPPDTPAPKRIKPRPSDQTAESIDDQIAAKKQELAEARAKRMEAERRKEMAKSNVAKKTELAALHKQIEEEMRLEKEAEEQAMEYELTE